MKILIFLSAILTISFGLSLASARHWIFDLFRNFMFQYFLGAAILFLAFVFFKAWLPAIIMLAVAVFSYAFVRDNNFHPPANRAHSENEPYFRVAQFNKHYLNDHHLEIEMWARQKDNPFDVILIEESQAYDHDLWEKLSDTYPFQVTGNSVDETYILSRHPVEEVDSSPLIYKTQNGSETGRCLHLKIRKTDFHGIISLYAIHTKVPTSASGRNSRDGKLLALAERIAADPSPYIIAGGDWNITAYSPAFKSFVKNSGLKYGYTGWSPVPTWPTMFLIPALQIPLDYTLGSQQFHLINQTRGKFLWSDHYATVSTFTAKP